MIILYGIEGCRALEFRRHNFKVFMKGVESGLRTFVYDAETEVAYARETIIHKYEQNAIVEGLSL